MMISIKKILTEEGKFNELVRFGIVGGIATVLQYLFYVLLVDVAALQPVPSQMISYILSFIYNYIASTFFTFRKKPNPLNAIGFAAGHAVNMGLQAGLVAIFARIVGDTLALLPAMAICIPVNFILIRFVFNSRFFTARTES